MVVLILALILLFVPGLAFAQSQPHIIMILADDALRGHVKEFRTDSVDTTWTGAGDTTTPNLDLIGQGGVMIDHLITAQVCSPSRAMVMGYGYQYMPTNLMGRTQTMDGDQVTLGFQDVTHTTEINPYIKSIVDYAHDQSYEVVFIGKWHNARLSWHEQTVFEVDTPGASDVSMLKAMGFDRADYMLGNVRNVSYLQQDGTLNSNAIEQSSHNNFVVCTLEGVCSVQTAKHSTVYFMDALQADLIANTNTKTLYFFFPPVAHNPYNWTGVNDCGDPVDTEDCNDRISGSSCTTVDCIFEEFIEDLDSEIGDLMADMNNTGGLLCTDLFDNCAPPCGQTTGDPDGRCDDNPNEFKLDTLFFTWDNGIPLAPTGPTDCENSAGGKQTPFPCGVENGMVIAGAEVQTAAFVPITGHITALRSLTDLPKTLEQMMGGTGSGYTSAGSSFADCLDGTVTVGNCPAHDFVPYTEWHPTGSNKTKGTMPNRMPDCLTDAAADWDLMELGGWTHKFNDRHLLHRVYEMNGNCNYFERLYATAGTGDRYVVLDAEQPIADTGPTHSANNFIDCLTTGGDWQGSYSPDQDDEDACFMLQRETDGIIDRLGRPNTTF